MSLLGVNLMLWLGPTVAVPAPPPLLEALESVTVTHNDQGRSGFQISFHAGRSGPRDLADDPLLLLPQLRPFTRVVVIVVLNAIPRVLIDGIVTNQQYNPSNDVGASMITLTGEDVSLMMDLEEKIAEHPAQPEPVIALEIIASYAQYGLIPLVIPPGMIDVPIPIERTPVQHATDLAYLNELASRNGYVFYIMPGPAPLMNTAYWGPPIRAGVPQRALSINMGPESNVDSLSFQYNSLSPTRVSGKVLDRLTNQSLPVETFVSLRLPLASMPALPLNLPNVRTQRVGDTNGLSVMQAYARAQGVTDKSTDEVVTATGTLDAMRYGDLLMSRSLVGLRGAGFNYDGFYYVKSVTHTVRPGEYKQQFTLTREGVGSTTPVVIP